MRRNGASSPSELLSTLRLAVAVLLASAGGCALSASAQALTFDSPGPFDHAQVATSDHGEVAVVWRVTDGKRVTIHASIGTPGRAFATAQTISPPSPNTQQPGVAMDAVGNVVVVWEDVYCTGGYKGNCDGYASLGVFASVRPAGGSFRAPVRLSAPQGVRAAPLLAMNGSGDWIAVMRQLAGTSIVTARGAGSIASSALGRPGVVVHAVALDAAGNATLAAGTSDQHPATIVRSADGTIGDVTVLDIPPVHSGGLTLGVGRQGHAVATWAAGGYLRFATRPPGGGFGPATTSGVPADHAPGAIGVDDRGRTITLLSPTPTFPAPFLLQVARGTVDAPFGEVLTMSHPNRDAPGTPGYAFSAGGDAALLWSESDRGRNRTTQLAIATDGGAFSAPRPLTAAAGETLQSADLAFDDAGRLALAWTSLDADRQRILTAAWSAPAGVVGPTVVAETRLPDPQPRASAQHGQVLRVRGDGTIRPRLRCESPLDTPCRGTVRIDAPIAEGRLLRAGTSSFVHRAGSSQRVTIRLTRATRRSARRRTLRCTITVRTRRLTGGYLRSTTALTLRRNRR